MRVILVNPPLGYEGKRSSIPLVLNNLFFNSPPLGICYIASVMEKKGIEVRIIDAPAEKMSVKQVTDEVKEYRPDIVGISILSYSFYNAVKIATKLKLIGKYIIIVGGPHVTATPEETMKYECFDVGIIGEGEGVISSLIKVIGNKKQYKDIKGIICKDNGNIVSTGKADFIQDLDVIPFPARHLVKLSNYRPQPNDEYKLPKLSMITTRGCPYSCIFCDKSVFGNSYRSFSPKYIVSEIKHLIERYNAKDIAFLDSTFTVSRTRIENIIKEMERQKVLVNWTCSVRVNEVDYDLLKKMKEAGCWRVRIGIESGNQEVLKFIKKKITLKQVKEVVHWAHDLGLQPKGFFMIGHLIDDGGTINDSINFAKSLPLKDVTVQINTPMKNTKQYKMHKEYGKLITNNFSDFSYWEPVFVSDNLTYNELIKLHRKFYREFYLRPAIFWRHIRKIRNLKDIRRYLRSLFLITHLFLGKAKNHFA